MTTTIVIFLAISQFDFSRLSSTGIVPPATQLWLKILLMKILGILFLSALLILHHKEGTLSEVGKHRKPLTEIEAELARTRRELAEVKMERDLLKKGGWRGRSLKTKKLLQTGV